jgi:type VI secretion system protein VasD
MAIGLFAGALSVIAGCGGNPPAPEPPAVPFTVAITAAEDLNPDLAGRPSPVTLVVLQLRSAEAFSRADYFAVYDPANQALAGEIINREQLTVQPGEQRTVQLQLAPEARYLGVAAAYRDIERASWLAVTPLGEAATRRKPGAAIRVGAAAVSATLN